MPHVKTINGAAALCVRKPFRASNRSHAPASRNTIRTRAGPVKEAERPAIDPTVMLPPNSQWYLHALNLSNKTSWHARHLTCDPQTKTLNEGIARFYDESSGLWESMWGEHMHHGKVTDFVLTLHMLLLCTHAAPSQ